MCPFRTWSRRTFLSTAGLTAAAAVSPRPLMSEFSAAKASAAPSLACIGFATSDSPSTNRIETYRVESGNWLQIGEALPCEAPCALVMHPVLPVLYVAHSTAHYLDLPRGSISAFTVNAASGAVVPLGRKALALSATYPDHLTISPDGSKLFVSASKGGSYNIFSLAPDGTIVRGPKALKQTGCGPHALQTQARPHSALFHPSGSAVYASDLGADRVNHITFPDDVPLVASRISLTPGDGPSHIALHPLGKLIIVSSKLRPSLSVIRIDENSGHFCSLHQRLKLDAEAAGPVSFGPSGEYLYVACSTTSSETVVSAFRLEPGSLHLCATEEMQVSSIGRPKSLLVRNKEVLLLCEGGIASLPLNQPGKLNSEPHVVLRRRSAASIALLSI